MFSRTAAGMTPEQAVAALNTESPVLSADQRNAQRRRSDERLVSTQILVDGLVENWARAPQIIVARNMQDPQVPQIARDYDATLKSQGSDGEARGFILDGTVYLLADQLNTPRQTAEVLFHEALGHYGLKGVFGKGLTPILQQVGAKRRKQVLAKAREYGMVSKGISDSATWAAMSEQDRVSAAEEVLAEMAQNTPEIGFVQRAIAAIRTWLRANVPGFKQLALTDAEIVRSYILPARGFVTRSSETPQQSLERAMMAFSRGAGRFTSISVSRGTVSWLGFDGAVSLRADLQALANRHSEYYESASDVQRDIAFVMEKPDNWYIHDGGKVMLSREGTGNQIPQVRVELERSGADFVVRSVYVGDRRQIAKKMADKRMMLGGIGLGGQSLDSLSVADYLSAVGNRSSRPEPLPSSSPDTPHDGKAGVGDGQPVKFSRAPAAAAATSGWDAPVKAGFDDVIYELQDKNIDRKRVVEAITKSAGQVADSIDAYMKEDLFHKRAAKRVADFGTQELTQRQAEQLLKTTETACPRLIRG